MVRLPMQKLLRVIHYSFLYHRGQKFRVAFAEIGNLRSIVPSTVNFLALTATASKKTFDTVIDKLAMNDPLVVGTSPDRPNILLSVVPYLGLNDFGDALSRELSESKNMTPKTVVFCQSFTSCYQLYEYIRRKLKSKFTFPEGYPDLHRFRLVEMYHSGCMPYVRESVIASFTTPLSNTRIVIGTSSFGLGIDCPNIRKIVHYIPLSLSIVCNKGFLNLMNLNLLDGVATNASTESSVHNTFLKSL